MCGWTGGGPDEGGIGCGAAALHRRTYGPVGSRWVVEQSEDAEQAEEELSMHARVEAYHVHLTTLVTCTLKFA